MALNQSSSFSFTDDDFIDMEVSSSSNFLCYSITSPLQSIDFEFNMSSDSQGVETITYPADELFYKGKLLPLHLSPRVQMVRKLLQNPTTAAFYSYKDDPLEESCAIPFFSSSKSSCSDIDTLLESCYISPSESCRVSIEINPDECFFEWSKETNSFIRDHPRKYSWTKKLMQSSLYKKLKASGAFMKSLFPKSYRGNSSYAKAAAYAGKDANSKVKGSLGKLAKVATKRSSCKTDYESKLPYALKQSFEKEIFDDSFCSQRRSFSGSIQWHSANKSLSFSSTSISSSGSSSSSSSFSFSSNAFCDLQLLRRSNCANSELDNSIEGAIAHCKKSHQTI